MARPAESDYGASDGALIPANERAHPRACSREPEAHQHYSTDGHPGGLWRHEPHTVERRICDPPVLKRLRQHEHRARHDQHGTQN